MHYITVELWQRLQRAISDHDADTLASWSIDTAQRVAEVVRKSGAR